MNELFLVLYLLPLFLHFLLPFLLLSICLWACLPWEYLCKLLQSEVLRLRGPSCSLHVLLCQLLIQLRVSKHLAHIVNSHNLAITAHGFKKELHKVWVLHVVFFLDDKLIVQDVLRCEDWLSVAIAKVHSLTYAVEKGWELGCFIFKSKGSIAIDYLRHFKLSRCLLLDFRICFHGLECTEILWFLEILKGFIQLISCTITCSLDNSWLKLLPEPLEIPRIVIKWHD